MPFMLHVLCTLLADSHTANINVALPKLFFDIFVATVAENRDGDMLFVAKSGMQVRSDFQAVDGNLIGYSLEVDGVEDVAVLETVVLFG